MDLVDTKQPAIDRVQNVQNVLELLAQSLCCGSSNEEMSLSSSALTGLWIILTACIDTLEKIKEPDEE